ncbi:hypothetical protein FHS18_004828 [Paenibacillus phyllosphaerae]|uniref:Uncharacterized protein n=1 Tax=Paenibacillus phyllosphaerae TaxID=274593 RepID=A0A7W5B2L2_9BACL|nr:hypothetical protein [Paenibacillus phyllosphaerae]MBB3112726.1 hypothetical protein [Paenibacillus phyllosphaerae]
MVTATGITNETAIERFKRFYEQYRATSNVEASFVNAKEALLLTLMEDISRLAQEDNTAAIRTITAQWDEIRFMMQGSNDALKERLEREYKQG